MYSKKLSCVFVFLLLLLAAFLPVFAHEESVDKTITITDQGFTPISLSIHQGDTVTFINKGSVPHWPASDLHPTHGIYPEFDPKHELAVEEAWEFKFERRGHWNFHDHLLPTHIGFIDVLGADNVTTIEYKPTLKERIKKFVWRFIPSLKTKAFSKVEIFPLLTTNTHEVSFWIDIMGAKHLMEKLIAESNGGSTKDCHQEAHILGRLGYKLEHEKVFASGLSDCHSGFYHGAMEGLLQEVGTQNLSARMNNLCNKFPTSFGNFECLHGVGHGVLAYKNYDLPEAIEICTTLDTDLAKNACYGGAFMENIIAGNNQSIHKTKWINDDPHFPCNAMPPDPEIQYQCYLMQTSRMIVLFNYDFKKVAEECLNNKTDVINVCFQSMGRDAAGNTLRDTQKTIALCKYAPSTYFDACISGAIQVVIDFWGEKMGNHPYDFCKALDNEDSKDKCYNIIITRLPGMGL